MIATRVIADIVVLVSIPLLPWWLVVLELLVFLIVFRSFYEVFVAALLLDALYAKPIGFLWNFHFGFSIAAIGLFFAGDFLRKRLKF